MPNIKSAMKRVKVIKKKTLQNKMKKSELKTVLKRFREAVANNTENKHELLNLALKKVDQAAAKGLIHKNAASRKKSQLMKALNASNS